MENKRIPSAIIAGGGIGGMAAALSLARLGIAVTVLDRKSTRLNSSHWE